MQYCDTNNSSFLPLYILPQSLAAVIRSTYSSLPNLNITEKQNTLLAYSAVITVLHSERSLCLPKYS